MLFVHALFDVVNPLFQENNRHKCQNIWWRFVLGTKKHVCRFVEDVFSMELCSEKLITPETYKASKRSAAHTWAPWTTSGTWCGQHGAGQ
eukprot:6491021-Amphidinium_carterae.2